MTPYEETKERKEELGISRISDLLVLAPANDPFYMGQPSQIEKAEWFMNIWNRFGYTEGVHLRRIHYKMVSISNPPKKPDGTTYKNTESDEAILHIGAKAARYLGLIDADLFVDKRNAEPMICDVLQTRLPEVSIRVGTFEQDLLSPSFARLENNEPLWEVADKYTVEVWAEKSTMNDIIVPICQRHRINFIHGKGELSITLVDGLMKRAEHKPIRILYVSDFDPAGKSMPVAISRKIEYMKQEGMDIELMPLLLDEIQCAEYKLPRTPIKKGEKRAKSFESAYGAGATELDALEANHPGELAKLLTAAIGQYRDKKHRREVRDSFAVYEGMLDDVTESIYENHREEVEKSRVEWRTIQEAKEAWEAKFRGLYKAIGEEIEAVEIEEYELPEEDQVHSSTEPLFSTDREYMEQLKFYKKFQNKEVQGA